MKLKLPLALLPLVLFWGPLFGQAVEVAPKRVGPYEVVVEVPREPVQNQGKTGTCWSYATTSFLETEVLRLTGQNIALSEMFVVRHAIIEKAKRFVMLHGKTQFGEGGLSHDVMAMVKAHGIVPKAAYTGLVEGQAFHDHEELFKVLEILVKRYAESVPDGRWLKGIAGLVDGYMGELPKTLNIDGKEMTPHAYAHEHLRIPVNDYVEVMSFRYAPFYEKAQLLVPDNWMMYGGYLNLPLDDFMANFESALRNGFSVAIDLDVSEETYRPGEGRAELTKELEEPGAITQDVREALFESRKTTDDHLIHVVGIVKDKEGKRLFLAKDSWGAHHGRLKGYRVLTENYVRAKVLAYMVHKDALIQR